MKRRFIFVSLCFVIILTIIATRIISNYGISCDEYAEIGVKGEISHDINVRIGEYFNDFPITNDILHIEYSSDNKIKGLTVNSLLANRIALNLTNELFECLQEIRKFGFPIGNTLGTKFFSGKGPKISVKIVPVGSIEFDLKSDLISSGINQTLYRLHLDFYIKISIIAPFYEKELEINSGVILSEILIFGDVPNVLLPSVE